MLAILLSLFDGQVSCKKLFFNLFIIHNLTNPYLKISCTFVFLFQMNAVLVMLAPFRFY